MGRAQDHGDGEFRPPPELPRLTAAPLTVSPAVLGLRDELGLCETHAARELALEHFWSLHPRAPILEVADPGKAFAEGRYTVTFLWQDAEAEEVLLSVDGITDVVDLTPSLMRRVPGTDLWHLSYRMRGDWRASYGFVRRLSGEPWPWSADDPAATIEEALDRALPDPRNSRHCRNRIGSELSVVALPDAPVQSWLERRADLLARGRVTERLGPDARRVWVYEPPEPARAAAPLPVVVLLDGEVWTGTQDIATTVDNLIADRVMRSCLIVMPHSEGGPRPRGASDGGPADEDRPDNRAHRASADDESEWIARELLPWVRDHYEVSDRASDVIVAGQGLGGYTALCAAIEFPDLIGGVLSQSAALWQRRLPAPDLARVHQLHVYLEVGRHEPALQNPNERLASEFTRFGADTHFSEYNGGHDYACWRGGIAEGLQTLLGPPA